MNNKILLNPDCKSGLIMFLSRRLCFFGNTVSVSRVKSAHKMMERRVYLKRLRKFIAGGHIQVPHPIFMKRFAINSQIVQVWRAKIVANFMHSLEARNEVTALQVSPKTIKELFNMFNEYVEQRKPFSLKFVGSCSKWIVMKFTFPPEIGSNLMLVTFQMLEDDGFSSNLHSFVLSRTNTPNFGVELKLNGDNNPLVHFFYTDALKIGFHPFNYDKFSVQTVTFYESHDTGCKKKRFLLDTSIKSKNFIEVSKKLAIAPYA